MEKTAWTARCSCNIWLSPVNGSSTPPRTRLVKRAALRACTSQSSCDIAENLQKLADKRDDKRAAEAQEKFASKKYTARHGPTTSLQCEYQHLRIRCKDCAGSGMCEHRRVRRRCKDCGCSGICEHQGRRSSCKDCREAKDHAAAGGK